MSISLRIKKGADLNIAGGIPAGASVSENISVGLIAVCPDDFPGLTLKPEVKEGDKIAAGGALLHDKTNPEIKVVSPVAGTIKAIVRGERRKILRIEVEADASAEPKKPAVPDLSDRTTAISLLEQTGLWAMMRQRPFGIVPRPEVAPRDIFVTALDTAPLAPDFSILLKNQAENMSRGAMVLSKLTEGKIYVARREGSSIADIKGCEMVDIVGPHPSGNAGTIIANISPVNKGETVWTLDALTLARIGEAALSGIPSWKTIVAVTGSEVVSPKYVSTVVGAEIAPLIAGNINPDNRHHRIISGNVLTGKRVPADGFLRYPYTQITVIPEGDDTDEFMGWASVSPNKMSLSSSFPGHFLKRKFAPDARILGGRRAMIMSGEYDELIPMDIMAEYLIKAIVSRDIDKMEQLGIYEVVPEDFALAEYADTSKLELQKIVADGIDYFRKETE